jgi:hypothetical protein
MPMGCPPPTMERDWIGKEMMRDTIVRAMLGAAIGMGIAMLLGL